MTNFPEPIKQLPDHLFERCRNVNGHEFIRDGDYILYWMHSAARMDENPALDTAIHVSHTTGDPLYIIYPLAEDMDFANDRKFAFLLQGARELARGFKDQGVYFCPRIAREGKLIDGLHKLSEQASLVITDEMPVDPWRSWIRNLGGRMDGPLIAIDTDCVVPLPLVNQIYDRAYKFRDATADLRDERIGQPWPEITYDGEYAGEVICDFDNIDFEHQSIADILADCRIDHQIGPVPQMPGGQSMAEQRWDEYRDNRLKQYAGRRNDPTDLSGVSRMSPYLHAGHISPFKLARQAHEMGASKYIDELCVWREMGYHWCHRTDDHNNFDALPDWAKDTLRNHQDDDRGFHYSWETLARYDTHDRLWNAAQASLHIHGELHNNMRMTWAKQIIPWRRDPEMALKITLDLNHRYALDGNNPNSYTGILWSFGQFDRPFSGGQDIFGKLRRYTTDYKAERMDLDAYEALMTRPLYSDMPKIAVIGAGMSGLTAARTLHDHGINVSVFDKGRGIGGRMSTRRASVVDDEVRFDHGAQYFTVRDKRFHRFVDSWITEGLVKKWNPKLAVVNEDGGLDLKNPDIDRYVATPKMNVVTKHLAKDLGVQTNTRITNMIRKGDQWILTDDDGAKHGPFDTVITSAPAEQTRKLFKGINASFQDSLAQIQMSPCWTVMIAFDDDPGTGFEAAFDNSAGDLSWVADNTSKPDRMDGHYTWILHSTDQFAKDFDGADRQIVIEKLTDAFQNVVGPLPDIIHADAHYWRYSMVEQDAGSQALFDPSLNIGACGDYCVGGRVEGAFLSGAAMAGYILRHYAAQEENKPDQTANELMEFESV
jgi:hypothetical protein